MLNRIPSLSGSPSASRANSSASLSHGALALQRSRSRTITHASPSSPDMAKSMPDMAKVLYSEQAIDECLTRLGKEIGREYKGKKVLVLSVLKGGFMFTADLIRKVDPYPTVMQLDFIKASSYGSGTETSGVVEIEGLDISTVKGKDVLIMEDIVDSGLTLSRICSLLRGEGGAASVKVCALLDKRARRKVEFEADWVGFDCPDEFVVGYGIDFSEHWRFLPFVGVPKPEAVERVRAEINKH